MGSGMFVMEYDAETGESAPRELSPEEVASYQGARHLAQPSFTAAEDTERLRVVAERSRTDPAFAALAELSLKGVQL